MVFFRQTPLKKKLIGIIMLSCGVVLLLASATFVLSEVYFFRQALLDKTSSLAGILATNTSLPLLFGDSQTAEKIIASLGSEPHISEAYIFDKGNKPFARFIRGGRPAVFREKKTPSRTCDKLAAGVLGDGEDYCFTFQHLAYFHPIVLEGRKIGTVFIQSDLDALYARLARYAVGLVLVLASLSPLVYSLASRLQRVVSAPVLHLADKMRLVSRNQDFSVRAEKQSDDEVGRLIGGFNDMLTQLESRDCQLEEYRHSLEAKVAKRTEQLQEAKKAAEAASLAKGRFLATMSHEIRTPMSGLLGMTELLVQSDLSDRQRSLALTAHRSGEALLGVLNDILDFSKIEAGKLKLERFPFAPLDVVEKALDLFARNAFSKGLELVALVSPEVPETLLGDSSRLRQVLLNLIGNAIKFTDRGEVTVRLALENQKPGASRIRFEVCDTGIGVAPEAQKHIFASFSQADDSTTRHYGGSGLGLTIVRELVELMGGRIELESEAEEGSTFAFSLWFDTPDDARPIRLELPAGLVGRRILVLAGNPRTRLALGCHLQAAGMLVAEAADAATALKRLEEPGEGGHSFVAALVDAGHGEISEELLAAVGRGKGSCGLPLIVLRPPGDGDDSPLAGRSVTASLSKPVRLVALGEALCDSLSRPEEEASAPPESAAPKATPPENQSFPGRILLAEDNRDVQQLLRIHLEKRGFQVMVVADGREAVAMLERERFHLVFMDYNMPEMDGPEATRRVRQKGDRTPIIALTAHSRKEMIDHFVASGVDDYLCKPFKQKQLVAVLEKWIAPPGALPG